MKSTNLYDLLTAACKSWPSQTALVAGTNRVSYRQLDQKIERLASTYRRIGIKTGDRIICSTSNCPEYIVAIGAAWACGAVHVGVDYQCTGPELSYVVELTQAKAVIFESAHQSSDPLMVVRENHPDVRIYVVGNENDADSLAVVLDEPIASTHASASSIHQTLSPEDPAIIFITSGTTGKPKATIGYQGNLGQRWQRLGKWLKFTPDDIHLAQLPLAHGFGLMMAISALLAGGRLALVEKFDAKEVLNAIEAEGVTVLNGAPAHFKLILKYLETDRHDVSSLRFSVGTAAAFPTTLVESIWNELGVDFMFMYGSSEGVGVATTDRDDILRGSVGRPTDGAVEIVGSDKKPLPIGDLGEIAFSRKVYPVRYWGKRGPQPATATPNASQPKENDSWYYSGDLGRLDAEGRLYVFGRLKHQIDRGGLKVDPVEVENALMQLKTVSDTAVIGLPNAILGEVVCACVVPASESTIDLDQIRADLGETLAPYKLPDELFVLDKIPRTRMGKVNTEELTNNVMAVFEHVSAVKG